MTVTVPTLGKSHGNWRRVKKGLPQRYRLFFMFASNPLAVVIHAWLNDEDMLRKEGKRVPGSGFTDFTNNWLNDQFVGVSL